ncbi:MAG: tetratricopeptide repeat protein, partial [Terriglobia bacterium]
AETRSADWPFQPPSAAKSVEIGNFYFRRGNFPGALSRYREAIRTDPDYAPAYLALGKVYEATGKRRKALATYKKYLAELHSDRDAARAKGAHNAIARLKQEIAKNRDK